LKVSFASYFRKRLSKENFLVCHYLYRHQTYVAVADLSVNLVLHLVIYYAMLITRAE